MQHIWTNGELATSIRFSSCVALRLMGDRQPAPMANQRMCGLTFSQKHYNRRKSQLETTHEQAKIKLSCLGRSEY